MDRSTFSYTKLDSPSQQIRLLSFEPGSEQNAIHCKLQVLNVDDAHDYNAISYTWGKPLNTHIIVIDGLSVPVRGNCCYALRQAQNYQTDMYYWIDAICINQDDVEEKNVQVAMMGEIYARATCVLACIGPHHDDSRLLFDLILKSKYVNFSQQGLTRARLAINHIASRAYFQRLWVVQELHKAKKVLLCCGMDILSTGAFFEVAKQNIAGTTSPIPTGGTGKTLQTRLGGYESSVSTNMT